MKSKEAMKINNLYYITHIDNLPSILEQGILSYDRAGTERHCLTSTDTGNRAEQRNYRTPDGKELWFYANLYFQPRNAMMYRILHQNPLKNIVVVAVDREVMHTPDVFITDGNAASETTQFYTLSDGLKILKHQWRVIQNDWWNCSDGSKRKMMAECLIPNQVKPRYIRSVYVPDATLKGEAEKRIHDAKVDVHVQPDMFFQPRRRIAVNENISLIDGGDIFFSRLQTLTVTVNLKGVMGKGLALRAKEQFPDVYVAYEKVCRTKKITAARPYIYKRETSAIDELMDLKPRDLRLEHPMKWFLLFATKRDWRAKSRMEDIEAGLKWLEMNCEKEGVQSIAMAALGCALGGLNWIEVAPRICRSLQKINIPAEIYLPREYPIEPKHLTSSYLLP